ncbi:YcjF family protein [Tropicimonas sp. S265A]|uniref:YcjF family protein n=1 Tax=Tropicimonas sp. S265A TaxID=3415134 RepID=UPI003C7E635D
MAEKKGAVLIDLEDDAPGPSPGVTERPHPASAPPVPDVGDARISGATMQQVAALAARRPSRVARVFWSALLALVLFAASVAATNFVTDLLTANPVLGAVAAGLFGLVLLCALIIAWREWRAFSRIARLDVLHEQAEAARSADVLSEAKVVAAKISALYHDRPELAQARARLKTRTDDAFDVSGVFTVVEADLLAPLDQRAEAEVSAAARQVATVTALVPLALADVIAALTANLRMIRRIAEIYGGRSGTLGSWRLTREVLSHLVATGAVAVGDDLIGSVAGGGVLSKVSRRFGEGVVNGALTARVGVAAMEVCRPLPFGEGRRPSISSLVKRALTGLFSQKT